jgi:hypothetical protein
MLMISQQPIRLGCLSIPLSITCWVSASKASALTRFLTWSVGVDGAGIVVEVGSECVNTTVKPGDRVYGGCFSANVLPKLHVQAPRYIY